MLCLKCVFFDLSTCKSFPALVWVTCVVIIIYVLVPLQDVFLMVRHDKLTIFLDATEETTVLQLKKMLEGIVKKPPEDQKLYNVDTKDVLEDSKSLGDCGYKSQGAKAQDPASIGLAYRISKLMQLLTCVDARTGISSRGSMELCMCTV